MLTVKVKRVLGIIVILALVIGSSAPFLVNSWPAAAQDGEGDDLKNSLVHELQELTDGKVRISTHDKTGKVRFIGTELSNSIPQPATLKASASPEDAARGFLSEYGPVCLGS